MKVKELKLKLPKQVEVKGVKVRPYLKTDEIGLIVSECSEIIDVVVRDRLANQYVLKFCADIECDTIEDYDLLKASGMLQEVINVITNIDELLGFIYETDSTNSIVRKGVVSLTETLEKLNQKLPKDEKQWGKVVDFLQAKLKGMAK